MPDIHTIAPLLEKKYRQYNHIDFIAHDPICIPHRFSNKADIEIAALLAAVFAWGNRTTIIQKASSLLQLMDDAPHDFCLHHSSKDLKKLKGFKHRTFNETDLRYFIRFLQYHYQQHQSLESAFCLGWSATDATVENGLKNFHNYFFSLPDAPARTKKHISTPARNSSCKRLNMFLRWMVRRDDAGIDFGIWQKIQPAQLVMPIDVHVARVAKSLQLLNTDKTDWPTALLLTETLRQIDPQDPVRFDFALFGMGVNEGKKL
jgi:uncharacterized protein (TIGR02757 family)